MKTVYFVRHGESEANTGEAEVFQGPTSLLTEKGKEQARFIAKRAAELRFDTIISSPAVRTIATADAIRDEVGKDYEVVDLFIERKLPSELLGKSRGDERAETMYRDWLQSFYTADMRVGDGENFAILKARVQAALQYLQDLPEKKILVTTHGFFLHMTVALVLLGDTLTVEEFKKIARSVWMDNTGITRIEYRQAADNKKIDRIPFEGWILRVWNDHAHLG